MKKKHLDTYMPYFYSPSNVYSVTTINDEKKPFSVENRIETPDSNSISFKNKSEKFYYKIYNLEFSTTVTTNVTATDFELLKTDITYFFKFSVPKTHRHIRFYPFFYELLNGEINLLSKNKLEFFTIDAKFYSEISSNSLDNSYFSFVPLNNHLTNDDPEKNKFILRDSYDTLAFDHADNDITDFEDNDRLIALPTDFDNITKNFFSTVKITLPKDITSENNIFCQIILGGE